MNISKTSGLKFGIILSGILLKRWQYESIQKLLENGHSLKLVIQADYNESLAPPPESKFKKYFGKNALYNYYTKFFHKPYLNDNVKVVEYLASYPHTKVIVERKGKYTDRFLENDITEIKTHGLDFILRFGLNIIRGDILKAAKYGIWSLHHDDEQIIRGGPPGFWEIAKGHNINGILLQQLTETLDKGITLRKAYVPIIHHSYKTHHNELLKYGIDLIVFAANELSLTGKIRTGIEGEKKGSIYHFPRNIVMLKFFINQIANKIRFQLKDLFKHENWNFGISTMSFDELFQRQEVKDIHWHSNPSINNFYADAFLYHNSDGSLDIFYENFDYKTYKANIDKCTYSDSEGFSKSSTYLSSEHHISFPYVYEKDDERIIIPESHVSEELRAYSSPQSSFRLMNKGAIDAVIINYNNLYWTFCTFKDEGSNIHLFAFYNESLDENWKAHKLNPIVSDARKARMAGDFLFHRDRLYRPAQINHENYGSGIQWMEIKDLSPSSFEEEEVFKLSASSFKKYNKGMHTISFARDKILIDAKNYKFVGFEFFRKLKQKL